MVLRVSDRNYNKKMPERENEEKNIKPMKLPTENYKIYEEEFQYSENNKIYNQRTKSVQMAFILWNSLTNIFK